MNIFFGKIKPTTDNKQIKEAYYETLSPMKLGELQKGDYAFIISGQDVHLWRAKEKVDIEGHPKMNFEVILDKLPMTSLQFVAFKYFKLDSSLIVLTIRQSPKAFYPIGLADNSLTESMLCDRNTYLKPGHFRKIKIFKSKGEIDSDSLDVQLYFDEHKSLQIIQSTFFDENLFPNFVDNLKRIGNGRKMKDKALEKIREGAYENKDYSYDQLSLLRMYDALFNDYGNPETAGEVETEGSAESIENFVTSLELKSFNQIFYGPPGTGKTFLVRNSFCLEEEIIINKSEQIKIDTGRNFWHLAPGRNGYLWNDLKAGSVLGYEWVDKSWGDLKQLTPKDIEDEGWGSYQLISYLREVKQGDYICVISGKKLLGIAEVTKAYDHETAITNTFAFQTVPIKWLKQFEQPLYLNSSQTKTFVRLNHGRRWSTMLSLLRESGFYFNDTEVAEHKTVKPKNFSFVTFHQSFSYEDFIEGIKPVFPDVDEDETVEAVRYELAAGIFYRACEKAVQLAGYATLQDCLTDNKANRQRMFGKDKELMEYYLIIDELNRGNVAAIFGELITLIEDDKRLGLPEEIIAELPYSKNPFGVPPNLRIVGTMNTADRSIEALDTALRRRFSFEELMPNPLLLADHLEGMDVSPRKLLININNRMEKLLGRDHTIGHSFLIKVQKVEDLKKAFANKIIPLLQEYFYSDYARIGLVLGMPFLTVKAEKSTLMKVDYYDGSDIEDRIIYSLKNIDTFNDEQFLTAVRGIYGA